jgi:tRNA(Ile)-lysidine synthase
MQMTLTDNIKGGLHRQLLNGNLKLGFRRRGEYFHPVGRRHSRSLKKLLQEAGVPPWERDYIPLLYCNEELIAVIGLWLSEKHVVGEDESGWDIRINNL